MNGRLNRIRYARLLIAALLVAVIAPSHAVPSNRIGPIAPLPKFEHTPSFPRQASDPVAGVADYPGICNPTSVGPSLGAYTTVGTEVFDTDALTYGGLPGPLSVALLALMALYLGLDHGIFVFFGCRIWRRGGAAVLWALPALWVALEWWRGFFFGRFPWNLAAYAWTDLPGALSTPSPAPGRPAPATRLSARRHAGTPARRTADRGPRTAGGPGSWRSWRSCCRSWCWRRRAASARRWRPDRRARCASSSPTRRSSPPPRRRRRTTAG